MSKEKGQGLIEFAFVFPFVIILLFGIIYAGIMFYDYASLSNIARSSTREAAISQQSRPGKRYTELEERYKEEQKYLLTGLYETDGADYFKIEEDQKGYITTTISMKLPSQTSYVMRMVLPNRYVVRYYMRKEFRED